MRSLSRTAVLTMAATGLIAAGCQAAAPRPSLPPATATPVATPTFTATEAAFDANRNPLSGLPSAHADVALRSPSAASISFAAEAGSAPADLAGLQGSELVFLAATIPVRLIAMTLEAPGERPDMGPLGVAWPLDLALARQFGATLRAASASPGAALAQATAPASLRLLSAPTPLADARPLGTPPRPNWTFSERPDALALQIVRLVTVTARVALPGGGGTPAKGDAASGASVNLPPTSGTPETPAMAATPGLSRTAELAWRYDPALTVYRFEMDGQAVVDQATGEGITVANLVFLMYPRLGDAESPEAFTGAKDIAVLIRDGHAQPLDWERLESGGPFRLLDGYQKAASLRPGNTWVVLSDARRPVDWWPEREFEPRPTPAPTSIP